MKFKMFVIAVVVAVGFVLVRRLPTATMKRATEHLKPLAAKY